MKCDTSLNIESVIREEQKAIRGEGAGEPNPVQHLREYNNYTSPRTGAFSADLWTVIATVSRNTFLNWLVLIPLLLLAIALFNIQGPR